MKNAFHSAFYILHSALFLMLAQFPNALVLTGPTGSGKSALGLELAERLGAEIVALDSMTLYRGMDIGTAKPTAEDRRRVPHHLIDVREPWQSGSVAWWLEQAIACARAIEQRGKRVLFVGGTALYLKALLCGLFDGPPAEPEVRQRLMTEAEQLGGDALHERLRQIDPPTAERLHPNDIRRIVRALEVWELTGEPISVWQQQWTAMQLRAQPNQLLYLDLPREELYRRIDARVPQMLDAGLVEEVRTLTRLPQPLSKEAAQALGYKEMFAFLEGRASLAETVQLIQTRSRQFAKRQLTWFRHLPECRPATRELTFTLWQA
jgi:tRNA dimethylallyltransferase